MAVVVDHDTEGNEFKTLVDLETRLEFGNRELDESFLRSHSMIEVNNTFMLDLWYNLPVEIIEKILVHLSFCYYRCGAFDRLARLVLYFDQVSKSITQHIFENYDQSENNELKCLYLIKFVYKTLAILKDEYNPCEDENDICLDIPKKLGQIRISSRCKDEYPMRKHNYLFDENLVFDGFEQDEISDTTTRTFFCLEDGAFDTSYLLYHNSRSYGEPAVFDVSLVLNPVFCFDYKVAARVWNGDESFVEYSSVDFDMIYHEDWEVLTKVFTDLFGRNTGVIVNDFIRIQA